MTFAPATTIYRYGIFSAPNSSRASVVEATYPRIQASAGPAVSLCESLYSSNTPGKAGSSRPRRTRRPPWKKSSPSRTISRSNRTALSSRHRPRPWPQHRTTGKHATAARGARAVVTDCTPRVTRAWPVGRQFKKQRGTYAKAIRGRGQRRASLTASWGGGDAALRVAVPTTRHMLNSLYWMYYA